MSITTMAARPARGADRDSIRPSASRLDLAALADIVGGLAEAEELWRPHVTHDHNERTRVRLLATSAYEVWLLGWTPGQSVGLHDHGGANGAFVVVDGTLTETVAADPSNRNDRTLAQRVLAVGEAGQVAAGQVHDVANRSSRLATSIHAYSRPLTSMGFYESATPGVRGHRIRTFWVEPEPVRLAPSNHSTLLRGRHLAVARNPRLATA